MTEVKIMSMDELMELEMKLLNYMEEVTEDNVIDRNEIIKLGEQVKKIIAKIEEDHVVTPEEKEVYERVSEGYKELLKHFEVKY